MLRLSPYLDWLLRLIPPSYLLLSSEYRRAVRPLRSLAGIGDLAMIMPDSLRRGLLTLPTSRAV